MELRLLTAGFCKYERRKAYFNSFGACAVRPRAWKRAQQRLRVQQHALHLRKSSSLTRRSTWLWEARG